MPLNITCAGLTASAPLTLRSPRIAAVVAALSAAFAAPALASGFAVQDQSAASLGLGHVGVALADDASTALNNLAATTELRGAHYALNVGGIRLGARFSNQGSLSPAGTSANGAAQASADGAAPLVSFFYARPLAKDLSLGFAMFTPFGLSTTYENSWVGRYQVQKAELKTLSLMPSVAWRVSDQLSLGAGLNVMRAQATLRSAVDFGTLCFVAVSPAACGSAGIAPQSADGVATIKGNSWDVGYQLAAHLRPAEGTRIGLQYKSRMTQDISGDARFANPALPGPFAALTQTPATTNGGIRSALNLPESLTLGVAQALSKDTELVAEYAWTRWSRVQDLRIRFANGAADSVTRFGWKDTSKFGVGVKHRVNAEWLLRAGLETESSAVTDANRNAVVPDSRRSFVGLGARYQSSATTSWDVGYGHIRFARASINNAVPGQGTVTGRYALDSDHFGVQFNRQFK